MTEHHGQEQQDIERLAAERETRAEMTAHLKAQLRAAEEEIARAEATGVEGSPQLRELLERLRELIASIEQFEASLDDAQRGDGATE